MGLSELRQDDEARTDQGRARLLEAARALMLRGEEKFSVAAVCAEAGLDRAEFRTHFSGRAALVEALAFQSPEPKQDLAAAIENAPAAQPEIPASATQEPPQADAWLERRLRVFERALNALEARAETREREQARTIALLEEKLCALGSPGQCREAASEPVKDTAAPITVPELLVAPAARQPVAPDAEKKPAPELVMPEAPQPPAVSKEEMAEVLQNARDKARAAAAIVQQAKAALGA